LVAEDEQPHGGPAGSAGAGRRAAEHTAEARTLARAATPPRQPGALAGRTLRGAERTWKAASAAAHRRAATRRRRDARRAREPVDSSDGGAPGRGSIMPACQAPAIGLNAGSTRASPNAPEVAGSPARPVVLHVLTAFTNT